MTLKYNQCACARLVADTYINFHFYFYSDTYRSHFFLKIVGDCLLPRGRGECNILNLISGSSNIHRKLVLALQTGSVRDSWKLCCSLCKSTPISSFKVDLSWHFSQGYITKWNVCYSVMLCKHWTWKKNCYLGYKHKHIDMYCSHLGKSKVVMIHQLWVWLPRISDINTKSTCPRPASVRHPDDSEHGWVRQLGRRSCVADRSL